MACYDQLEFLLFSMLDIIISTNHQISAKKWKNENMRERKKWSTTWKMVFAKHFLNCISLINSQKSDWHWRSSEPLAQCIANYNLAIHDFFSMTEKKWCRWNESIFDNKSVAYWLCTKINRLESIRQSNGMKRSVKLIFALEALGCEMWL